MILIQDNINIYVTQIGVEPNKINIYLVVQPRNITIHTRTFVNTSPHHTAPAHNG